MLQLEAGKFALENKYLYQIPMIFILLIAEINFNSRSIDQYKALLDVLGSTEWNSKVTPKSVDQNNGDTYFYIAPWIFHNFFKVYTFFYYTFLIHKMTTSLILQYKRRHELRK